MNECIEMLKNIIGEKPEMKDTLEKVQQMQDLLVRSEKMASVGRLSAGIAHEINNPIGFVSSNSTTLITYINKIVEILKMYQTGVSKEIIEKREKQVKLSRILGDIDSLIMENIEGLARITTIVSNLKKFSRESALHEMVASDINDGLRSVLILAKNELKYYADVRTDFGDIEQVTCNLSELNQGFLNIIVNAVHAIKGQGRAEKGNVLIKTYKDAAWIYVEISDDGPGIPQNIQGKIFDPFFTTKEVGVGTGLGLSITYDIVVNNHKGDITVVSEEGKGATFVIKLPRNRD